VAGRRDALRPAAATHRGPGGRDSAATACRAPGGVGDQGGGNGRALPSPGAAA